MSKISAMTELTTPATDDEIEVRDKSDTSQAPTGTNKRMTWLTTITKIFASRFAADAGSTDTYVVTLDPVPAAYVTGEHYRFKANTANTGACTVNFNGLGAKTIKKAAGGITTDLADNDIRAGQWVDLVYDGTNMQMQSLLGNAPAVSGPATQIEETSGPDVLDIGDIVDGEFLKRVGSEIVSDTSPGYAGITTGGTGSLDMAQGTKTADEPFIDGSVTWNAVGATFDGLRLAVTNTTSALDSSLVRFSVGGSEMLKVNKNGQVRGVTGSAGSPTFSFIDDATMGMFRDAANELGFAIGGNIRLELTDASLRLIPTAGGFFVMNANDGGFRWVNSTRLITPVNGVLQVEGNSGNQGVGLLLGVDNATQGARLKRNGVRLEAKLGDDSAYTQMTCEKLGVNNSAAATTPGSVTKKIEVFDAAGNSLGFIAVYDSIT